MEHLKIINERHNSLFSRKEVIVEIKKEKAPKKEEVESIIAEKFSSSADAVKIDKIMSKFGSDIFTITARIYK